MYRTKAYIGGRYAEVGRVEKNIKRIKSEGKRKGRKAGNREKESESGKRKRRNSLTGSKPRGIRFVWGRWLGGGAGRWGGGGGDDKHMCA